MQPFRDAAARRRRRRLPSALHPLRPSLSLPRIGCGRTHAHRQSAAAHTLLHFAHASCAQARSSHTITAVGDTLYLLGGEHKPREPIGMDVHAYSLRDRAWRRLQVAGAAPPLRNAHAAAAVGSDIYITSGRSGVEIGEAALNDLWKARCGGRCGCLLDVGADLLPLCSLQMRVPAVPAPPCPARCCCRPATAAICGCCPRAHPAHAVHSHHPARPLPPV